MTDIPLTPQEELNIALSDLRDALKSLNQIQSATLIILDDVVDQLNHIIK